jgi:hypothetical protein
MLAVLHFFESMFMHLCIAALCKRLLRRRTAYRISFHTHTRALFRGAHTHFPLPQNARPYPPPQKSFRIHTRSQPATTNPNPKGCKSKLSHNLRRIVERDAL